MGSVFFCGLLMVFSAAPPNVVLLSVDTLRADHLGCYHYRFNTSPAIDRFANDSLVFEDCICEVPLTMPSFGSIFCSLYPRMTGTTRNGLHMPNSTPLITEIFKQAGYQTLCVQSNWPLKSHLSGLSRGFDVYDDHFHKKRWGFMNPERDAKEVTDAAIDLLDARQKDKPFFMWIHYSDPHAPYHYHKDFNPSGESLWRLRGADRIRLKYDSEIAYADHHIGRLLAKIPDNTFIVFVADHGESLYEHNYLGHGRRIYQDNEHVPFIVHGPGIAPGRTAAPACIMDAGPTMLGLAGLSPAAGMLGKNALNPPLPAMRTRIFEAYGGAVPKLPGMHALLAERGPIRQGLLQGGWKVILGGETPELYYLPDDPGEIHNLASVQPDRVSEYQKIIALWNQKHRRKVTQQVPLAQEDVDALQSLGYLQ